MPHLTHSELNPVQPAAAAILAAACLHLKNLRCSNREEEGGGGGPDMPYFLFDLSPTVRTYSVFSPSISNKEIMG